VDTGTATTRASSPASASGTSDQFSPPTGIGVQRLARTGASALDGDAAGIHAGRPVACQRAFGNDLGADGERVTTPAVALQAVRRAQFATPVGDLAGGRIFHIEVDPDVRIGPLHFGDDAFQLDRFVGVEFCAERVVRLRRTGQQQRCG
jgi:hypothetical protein